MKFWRISFVLATAGLMAISVTGCDVTSEEGDATDTTPSDTSGGDTTADTGPVDTVEPPTGYAAVLIQDRWDTINCGCSEIQDKCAPGSDIDAVELGDGTGTILGYFDTVAVSINPDANTKCATEATSKNIPGGGNNFTEPDAAKGAPDGELYANYVALYDGWIIGEFDGQPRIQDGDVITVFEVGTKDPLVGEGKDEAYSVFLATDLDCVNEANLASCTFLLSDTAVGYGSIPATGF